MEIALDERQTLIVAILVLFLGKYLNKKVSFLRDYNIPQPVTGGVLANLPVFKYFEIDWWQLAPFVELGRVVPEYNSDLFFEDLKWGAGIGLRFMAFRNVVRLDFATSDDGSSVWAMFGQPFSRQGN